MGKIYDDYSDEPEDIFQPLTAQLSCDFYNMEMDSFSDDISFYQALLPKHGSILELGCGSGRISRRLATKERPVVGIDLCHISLRRALASAHPHTSYIQMDMSRLAFLKKFSTVIIPYNTLNLLISRENIMHCLRSSKDVLRPGGQCLLQLYIPSEQCIVNKKKVFQFQLFERPGGGRIVKEILKQYIPHNQTVDVEERYRVRPMQHAYPNENWNKKYAIAAFRRDEWLQLFTHAGFRIIELFTGYTSTGTRSTDTPCLLAHLSI